MRSKKILIPIPNYGCDPTEVGIPFKLLTDTGFTVHFTTPNGEVGYPDERMMTGEGLGVFKALLAARKDGVSAFEEAKNSKAFQNPLKYSEVNADEYDGIILPGGHDKRVKEYLESKILQNLVVNFFNSNKPVGAICHGVVLAARSIDPKTRTSVIHEYKTTALLETQEMLAYNLTRLWLKDYYLTYPGLTVQKEVTNALINPENFLRGKDPRKRDNFSHLQRGFVVRDRNYISGRWPGDVYNFSLGYIKMLQDL